MLSLRPVLIKDAIVGYLPVKVVGSEASYAMQKLQK